MKDDKVLCVAINKAIQGDNTDQKNLPLKCSSFSI